MEPGFLRANTGRTAIQDIGGKAGPSENSTNFEAKRHSQWYSGCEEYNTQLGSGGHGSGWQWVKLVTRKLHSRARRPYKPSSSSPLSTAWEFLYPREIRTWMSSDAFSTSLIPSMVCPVQLITWILRRDLSLILISNGVLATQFANIHIGFILERTRRKLWSILR